LLLNFFVFDEFVAYLCNNQPYFGANTLKLRFSSKPLVLAAKKQIFGTKNEEKRKKIWNLLHYLLILQMI
jgi:hypothetical protein